MHIKILCSLCAISDDFYDQMVQMMDQAGIDYTIEKVTNEEKMKAYGVTVNCLYGYCPGCRNNHADSEEKHTPALVVDEKLLWHGMMPNEEELASILERLLQADEING